MTTEEQNELELGIGDKEAISLKPAKVKIMEARIETIEKAKSDKVVLSIKHPDKEELINISSVKFIKGSQVTESGTWLNKDEDKKIRKGSALACLLIKAGANTIKELEGKELESELDKNGYLCLKAY